MSVMRNVLQFLFGPLVKKPLPLSLQQSLPATKKERGGKKQPRRSPQEGLTVRQLQAALALTSKVVTVRSSLPILSCCLLGNGQVVATDLEDYLRIDLPALTFAPLRGPVV